MLQSVYSNYQYYGVDSSGSSLGRIGRHKTTTKIHLRLARNGLDLSHDDALICVNGSMLLDSALRVKMFLRNSKPCYYCGMFADSKDHTIPTSIVDDLDSLSPELRREIEGGLALKAMVKARLSW